MRPLIPMADVVMFGSFSEDGEVIKKCRLTMIGQPADAVLFTRDLDGSRWHRVDRLTQAKVVENDDGTLTIDGVSEELVDVVGIAPADASVRWVVTPKGCSDCH